MRLASLVLSTFLTLPPAVSPAMADRDGDGPPEPVLDGRHCVAEATPPGVEPSPTTCYASFADAVAVASGGELVLRANASKVRTARVEAAGARSSRPIIGIEYQSAGYKGWTYVITASRAGGCDSVQDRFQISSVPSFYDDQISSARAYTGCLSRHYSGPSFSGTARLCTCSEMGTMDNRTSSIVFSQRG